MKTKVLSFATGAILLVTAAVPALAEVSLNAGVNASMGGNGSAAGIKANAGGALGVNLRDRAKGRADDEIDRRVKALTALAARLSNMQKLSDSEKSALSAEVQAQISAMADLKNKVDGDAAAGSTSTLKDDIKSITGSYRIFALIMPQAAIQAAADRVMTITGAINDIGGKIQAKITEAQTAGHDVSISVSAMADFTAKVSDANVQAQAAIDAVKGLTPDNGDQAKFQANLAALKGGRTKIQAAQQDLVNARKDAKTIVQQLRGFGGNTTASSTP